MGGKVYVNPDGHEWLRAKWSAPVRKYWKLSEKLMTKHADLMVCDSKNIEKYIKKEYKKYNPKSEENLESFSSFLYSFLCPINLINLDRYHVILWYLE